MDLRSRRGQPEGTEIQNQICVQSPAAGRSTTIARRDRTNFTKSPVGQSIGRMAAVWEIAFFG